MKKGRIAFASTLLMLLATVMAACGSGSTTTTKPTPPYAYQTPTTKGGTIIYSDWEFPDSTNPLFAGSVVDFEVISGLWNGPVIVSSDGKFLPDQVTEVPTTADGDVSKDGLTVTLHLRHDLKWSDGQPLTADDYKYMMDTLLDPNTAAASTFGYDSNTIASYTVTDQYTFTLKYVKVFAPYLTLLPFPLPKHAWGSIADKDLANTPEVNLTPKVDDGAFTLSDYASGQSFTLVPNPNFTSSSLHKSVVDKVVFQGFQSKDALIAGYQAGQTDHAEDFTLADLPKVNGLPGLHVAPNIAYEHIDFNLSNPVLADVNVRKAFEESIDRCQIIQSVLNAQCKDLQTDEILPPPSPDADPSIKAFAFNLTQAKADMQASGWDCSSGTCKKADGTAFPTLNLTTTAGNTQRKNVTEIVKQDLAALGVTINLDGQYYPASSYFADYAHNGILARGQYDLALYAYVFGVDSGSDLTEFDSSQIPTDQNQSGGNYERVNDPKVDQALAAGNATLDVAKRHQIYVDLQKYLVSQVYTIPMYLRPNITLTNANVQNYFDNPTSAGNEWNIGDWYLTKVS